jgi:hypothetical protein
MVITKQEAIDTEVKSPSSELELQEEAAGDLVYSSKEEKEALWRLDIILIPLYGTFRLDSSLRLG